MTEWHLNKYGQITNDIGSVYFDNTIPSNSLIFF